MKIDFNKSLGEDYTIQYKYFIHLLKQSFWV